MAQRPQLRPVTDGERAAESKSVTAAAKAGSPRDMLTNMRERIAAAIDDPKTPAAALAALTKRLMEVQRELESIDAGEQEASGADVDDGDFDASAI